MRLSERSCSPKLRSRKADLLVLANLLPPWTWKGRLFALLLLGGILGLVTYRALWPGLPFLRSLQQPEASTTPFQIEDHTFATASGRSIPMRVYRPEGKVERALLLLHGVHWKGYDEPRLTRFARQLAREGFLVATPDIADLKDYHLVPTAVDDIEASALRLLDGPGLRASALQHRPTILGVSFAGGLAMCAAGRPSLQHRLGGLFAFGSHGNLQRVLSYLATGQQPEGGDLLPHPYGQAVVARQLADRLVPAAEVEPLRAALTLFLHEQRDAFTHAVEALPPEAKGVAELFLRWDAKAIAARLRPLAFSIRSDDRLSPERNARPDCPLYFVHGAEDNVIPPSETLALGRWASAGGPSKALVTGLIRHVELEAKASHANPSWGETWALMRMLTEFFRA